MSNRDVAKHIARGIFATGALRPFDVVQRIQFKGGSGPDETDLGGLCEASLVSVIERLLATAPATGEKS